MTTAGRTVTRRIPMALPWIGERERELVGQVLASDSLALGPFAAAFEADIAERAGRRFGISCNSGTAGLHMVVRALGIADGDEVITTPFSFVASANCLLYERARPRFVDIEEDTLGLDPEQVVGAGGSRTKAVLPVQVFGRPCRIDEIAATADANGWSLIEDSCEALGSRLGDRPLGSYGAASVFAFYPNKQITTGEGGVVVTDDPALASMLRSLRNQGRDEDGTWLRHVRLGYNYRLDEMSAALGVAQLERQAELMANRSRVAGVYDAAFAGHDWVKTPRVGPGETVDWFVYVIRLDPALDRSRLMADIQAHGVPSRPYFSPIHLQPFYQDEFGHRPGDFPVTERIAASTLAIPFSARLSDDDARYVADVVIEAAAAQSRA
ncbi:MAG TPA: DegT/DnrJ/EryC1/StrS family aminotransferase [Candidatus Acidoferrum sp.]|nr:DegT/DnrJ/EryC1/StrS family aminotransferase [Candidatus Acidoferrum sp.]